jgi:nicotinamide mononucleotide transporter PnuC
MFWDILQYIGLFASFLYLWLEFHQRPAMWIVSATCSAIYASIYCHAQIYGDMSFSLFNICMCAYGFWKWITSSKSSPKRDDLNSAPLQEDKGKAKAIVYRHFRLGEFGVVTLVTAVIWLAIYLVLKYLTNSPVPALDAFTTTLNIVGTWVLAQKIIEVWGYWFLVNLVSIYLYMKRGLHFTTILLYTFYLCASVYGWWKWRHYGKLQSQCSSNP